MLPTKFRVKRPFGSGEEEKNRFSRWRPPWISNRNDFCFFIYKSPRYLLPSFKTIGLLFQEKKRKRDFEDGGNGDHLGFSIDLDFLSKVTPMLPTKFQVHWLFVLGEGGKIDFQDGGMAASYFLSTSHPDAVLSFKSIGLSIQEKKRKIDFRCSSHGGHLGFPIETIFASFYLQVTLMLPIKFQVNWRFGSGEETKNWFLR